MNIDFEKSADGLIPAVVQDANTKKILMLGYMNRTAFEQTVETGKIVFFSRSRQQLWTKGETSANFLNVVDMLIDCDNDTILVFAKPDGPVCHTGADTCFGETNEQDDFLFNLEALIARRHASRPPDSYTTTLFDSGLNRIVQKFGEEAIELVIEAKGDNSGRIKAEAADLLYHFLVLLRAKNISLDDVLATLKDRRSQ
jgi:phosphoribosyl-ATP pyrophosphohydrolase/phosphoribosyl-AMP cyclohydrolase